MVKSSNHHENVPPPSQQPHPVNSYGLFLLTRVNREFFIICRLGRFNKNRERRKKRNSFNKQQIDLTSSFDANHCIQ